MDKTLSRDGTSIAYRRHGDGPPVILVGGALSTAADEGPLAALLAPRFTVLTYDRRGRGASGDGGPWSPRREIEDLAAVAAAAGGPGRSSCTCHRPGSRRRRSRACARPRCGRASKRWPTPSRTTTPCWVTARCPSHGSRPS